VVTRNNFPEVSDEWLYVPEKHTKLKDQIICSVGNIHLINVLKIYTNNTYWGCIHTSINSSGQLLNLFHCKDRKGLSEDVVDDKDSFIKLYKEVLSNKINKFIPKTKYKTYKPDFLQEYDVKFILKPNGTYFGTTALVNNAPTRGLYGSNTEEEYIKDVKNFGISILGRFPTEEEVQTHIIDKQIHALSANFITRVNTAYSNVKVFHRSEINNGT
jgi:hypothetical protein